MPCSSSTPSRIPVLVSTLALCLLLPAVAAAYPIDPHPLWPLTVKADLIVVAEVTGVDPLPRDEDSWESAIARLRVIETLKGVEQQAVAVPFAAGLICPAPARYTEGETVVAFLARTEAGWRTVALSYGTLYPRGEELDDVKSMVRAAVAIQRAELSPKKLDEAKRKWLVQAAALPGTRWHGLYELDAATDSLHSYYEQGETPPKQRLGKEERALLAEALAAAPKFDNTFQMMLRLIGDVRDPEVDRLAHGYLEWVFRQERRPWWTEDLLWTVLDRADARKPEARLKDLKVTGRPVPGEELELIWELFKLEMDLDDLQPIEIELEEWVPVGGRTPS